MLSGDRKLVSPQLADESIARQMSDMIRAFRISQIVGTVSRLAIPDHLAGGALTVNELARLIGGHAGATCRLMRAAKELGLVGAKLQHLTICFYEVGDPVVVVAIDCFFASKKRRNFGVLHQLDNQRSSTSHSPSRPASVFLDDTTEDKLHVTLSAITFLHSRTACLGGSRSVVTRCRPPAVMSGAIQTPFPKSIVGRQFRAAAVFERRHSSNFRSTEPGTVSGPGSPGSPLVPLAAHGSRTDNRPKRRGPDGQSNCYPVDYPTSLSGLLSGLIFPPNA